MLQWLVTQGRQQPGQAEDLNLHAVVGCRWALPLEGAARVGVEVGGSMGWVG